MADLSTIGGPIEQLTARVVYALQPAFSQYPNYASDGSVIGVQVYSFFAETPQTWPALVCRVHLAPHRRSAIGNIIEVNNAPAGYTACAINLLDGSAGLVAVCTAYGTYAGAAGNGLTATVSAGSTSGFKVIFAAPSPVGTLSTYDNLANGAALATAAFGDPHVWVSVGTSTLTPVHAVTTFSSGLGIGPVDTATPPGTITEGMEANGILEIRIGARSEVERERLMDWTYAYLMTRVIPPGQTTSIIDALGLLGVRLDGLAAQPSLPDLDPDAPRPQGVPPWPGQLQFSILAEVTVSFYPLPYPVQVAPATFPNTQVV